MLYRVTKKLVLRLAKAPLEPPEAPAGSHDSIRIHRASPRYLKYRMVALWFFSSVFWIGWWVLFLAGTIEDEEPVVVIALIVLPLLVAAQLLAYFLVRIDYDMRYYIVTDRSLRVREGALIVKEQTITYANVQNLRVVQGPIQRLFRFWNLQVDTAGGGGTGKSEEGGGHTVQMAGIENAHEVRDGILEHLRRSGGGGSGLGDLDDVDARPAPVVSADLLAVLEELRETSAALRTAAGG